jgi:hypothetical protein
MPVCVVPILRERKPLNPLLRAGLGKAPEIGLQGLIDALGSTIRLRVIGRAQTQLSIGQAEEFSPEGACEHAITIRDDGLWHAMELEDIVKEETRHAGRSVWMGERNKVCIPGKFVDDYQYTIISARFRKSFDEIHRHNFPGVVWYRQGLEETRITNSFWLRLLANETFLHLAANKLLHEWPGEKLLDAPVCHGKARMPAGGAGMKGISNARL